MNFFYCVNGWAGQWAWLDATMRFFYVASVPLAATLWLVLLFFGRSNTTQTTPAYEDNVDNVPEISTSKYHYADTTSKRTVTIATALAFLLCGVLYGALNWFAQNVLQTPILSPRPFVTHWVNALVIEPNDNSFPSPEAMLLGVLWIAIWATSCRWNAAALGLGFIGCFARIFCGMHYFADVFVGFATGAAIGAVLMALCGVVLRFSAKPYRQRNWRLRFQSATSLALVFSFLIAGVIYVRETPRLWTKWQQFHAPEVLAQIANSASRWRNIEYSNSSKAGNMQEGEGVSSPAEDGESIDKDAHGKEIPRIGVTTTGGFLPREEARLLRALRRANLGHTLVSVDVAALRDGNFVQHCAAVRFQVQRIGSLERKRVAQTAQRIVKVAFAANSALQNVDVAGIVINAPQRDGVRYPVFAVGAIPVFTASVQRRNLQLPQARSLLNASDANPGLWLRARSKLYINERVLPARENHTRSSTPLFLPIKKQTSSTRPAPVTAPKIAVPQPVLPKVIPPKAVTRKATVKTATPAPTPLKKIAPARPRTPVAPVKKAIQPQRTTTRATNRAVRKKAPVARRSVRRKVYRSTRKQRVRKQVLRKRTYRRVPQRTWQRGVR